MEGKCLILPIPFNLLLLDTSHFRYINISLKFDIIMQKDHPRSSSYISDSILSTPICETKVASAH